MLLLCDRTVLMEMPSCFAMLGASRPFTMSTKMSPLAFGEFAALAQTRAHLLHPLCRRGRRSAAEGVSATAPSWQTRPLPGMPWMKKRDMASTYSVRTLTTATALSAEASNWKSHTSPQSRHRRTGQIHASQKHAIDLLGARIVLAGNGNACRHEGHGKHREPGIGQRRHGRRQGSTAQQQHQQSRGDHGKCNVVDQQYPLRPVLPPRPSRSRNAQGTAPRLSPECPHSR